MKGQKGNLDSSIIPLISIVFLITGVVVFYQLGTPVPEMDDRLCPKDTGPTGATLLLLDSSDPLTPKHRAELDRLAEQIASERADGRGLGVAPQELFVVYEMTQDPGIPNQLIEVCRPLKSPQNRTWRDDIRHGKRFAEKDWEHFEQSLAKVFPQNESKSSPTSPILETISVIAARHIPGKRGDNTFKVHLIVFSDLLQNSSRLSHFKDYPDAGQLRNYARDLFTDLTGVRVSLFRLERPKYAKWQNERHYYWWTELVQEQGGQIEWQDSI